MEAVKVTKEEPVCRFELIAIDQATRRVTVRVTTYNGIGQIVVMEVGHNITVNLPVSDTSDGKVIEVGLQETQAALNKMKGN